MPGGNSFRAIGLLSHIFLGALSVGGVLAEPLISAEVDGQRTVPSVETDTPGTIWITAGDGPQRLARTELVAGAAPIGAAPIRDSEITLNPEESYQTIEGFGFSLTGGSAQLIQSLSPPDRGALLAELFGNGPGGMGISYLRISIGASDLDEKVFSYDDLPEGEIDEHMEHFRLGRDHQFLLPLLRDILAINPDLQLLATPWSPPLWMKSHRAAVGGRLRKEFYPAYAKYLVKYLQAMLDAGIPIAAISLQNEPENDTNNPSMLMTAAEQADLVKFHVGPALLEAKLKPQILIWDHNCDHPEYPLEILNDPAAKRWVHGTAFHLYAGSPEAFAQLHHAHPDRSLFFTEQWTELGGNFAGDLQWHMRNVMIGTLRNWNQAVLEWNLASDPNGKPYTPGGCSRCQGALTIDASGRITRNVSYYIVAHASKFIPRGSVRIASNLPDGLGNVAFRTPGHQLVLIVLNELDTARDFTVQLPRQTYSAQLPPHSVGTLVWPDGD